MDQKAGRNVLIILLAALGIGAIFGGGVFIASPSGELFGMPLSMLDGSPFTSFLVPGIILFVVLGLAPVSLCVALVKKPESKAAEVLNFYKDMYWGWTYSVYTGFALIIWIQLQMVFLHAVHRLHTLYMFFAIAIIFVALLPQVRNRYRK